jgi:hypothetical protein
LSTAWQSGTDPEWNDKATFEGRSREDTGVAGEALSKHLHWHICIQYYLVKPSPVNPVLWFKRSEMPCTFYDFTNESGLL